MATCEPDRSMWEAQTEGADPIAIQSYTPGIVALLIATVAEKDLGRRPHPGEWSVAEIIAHLAEDEVVSRWRYRQMIEKSGCPLASLNHDRWARLGDYVAWKARDALYLFRLVRQANLHMFRRLTAHEWERYGVHAERGKISVRDLARHMAGHDRTHLNQIRGILGNPGAAEIPRLQRLCSLP